jgi:hypothetical protein
MNISPLAAATVRSGSGTAVPLPLPFDDEGDAPVPFVLTAAAQRDVLGRAPAPLVAVPPVVPGAMLAEPSDTRRVQARALLRSGMPVSTIAAALGVEGSVVADWTADLVDELARRRRRTVRSRSATGGIGPAGPAPREMGAEGRGALLAGLAFALTEVDGEVVTVRGDRLEPVAILIDGLRAVHPDLTERIRIALRVGPELPADRSRVDVAQRLGVDPQRIVLGRAAGDLGRMLDIRLDIHNAAAASTVGAWREGNTAGASGLRGWDSNPQTFRLTADCSAS